MNISTNDSTICWKKITIPKGLPALLEILVKETIRESPDDIIGFLSKLVDSLIAKRDQDGEANRGDKSKGNSDEENPLLKKQKGDHVISEKYTKLEEDTAASKIQAGFRGYQTRKSLDSAKRKKERTSSLTSLTPLIPPDQFLDQACPEQEKRQIEKAADEEIAAEIKTPLETIREESIEGRFPPKTPEVLEEVGTSDGSSGQSQAQNHSETGKHTSAASESEHPETIRETSQEDETTPTTSQDNVETCLIEDEDNRNNEVIVSLSPTEPKDEDETGEVEAEYMVDSPGVSPPLLQSQSQLPSTEEDDTMDNFGAVVTSEEGTSVEIMEPEVETLMEATDEVEPLTLADEIEHGTILETDIPKQEDIPFGKLSLEISSIDTEPGEPSSSVDRSSEDLKASLERNDKQGSKSDEEEPESLIADSTTVNEDQSTTDKPKEKDLLLIDEDELRAENVQKISHSFEDSTFLRDNLVKREKLVPHNNINNSSVDSQPSDTTSQNEEVDIVNNSGVTSIEKHSPVSIPTPPETINTFVNDEVVEMNSNEISEFKTTQHSNDFSNTCISISRNSSLDEREAVPAIVDFKSKSTMEAVNLLAETSIITANKGIEDDEKLSLIPAQPQSKDEEVDSLHNEEVTEAEAEPTTIYNTVSIKTPTLTDIEQPSFANTDSFSTSTTVCAANFDKNDRSSVDAPSLTDSPVPRPRVKPTQSQSTLSLDDIPEVVPRSGNNLKSKSTEFDQSNYNIKDLPSNSSDEPVVLRRQKSSPTIRGKAVASKYRSGIVMEDSLSMEEMEAQIENEMMSTAATKIQAGFRGYKTRKSMQVSGVSTKGAGCCKVKRTKLDTAHEAAVAATRDKPQAALQLEQAPPAQASALQSPDRAEHTLSTSKLSSTSQPDLGSTSASGSKAFLRSRSYPCSFDADPQESEEQADALELKAVELDYDPVYINNAATKIQANVRGFLARKSFRKGKRNAGEEVQDLEPGQTAENGDEIHMLNPADRDSTSPASDIESIQAASKIQAAFRGYKDRKKVRQTKKAVVTIQATVRGFLTRRRLAKLRRRSIQRRRSSAKSMLSPEVQKNQKANEAATRIQAVYRGYQVRSKIKKTGNDE